MTLRRYLAAAGGLALAATLAMPAAQASSLARRDGCGHIWDYDPDPSGATTTIDACWSDWSSNGWYGTVEDIDRLSARLWIKIQVKSGGSRVWRSSEIAKDAYNNGSATPVHYRTTGNNAQFRVCNGAGSGDCSGWTYAYE